MEIRGLAEPTVNPDATDAADASGVRGLCASEMSSSPGRYERGEGGGEGDGVAGLRAMWSSRWAQAEAHIRSA